MEQFNELYDLFETANIRRMPEGVTAVEFGEEISHFLVDEADDPEFAKCTWHDATGHTEPFVVEKPLSAQEFRDLIAANGRVRLAIAVSLDELHSGDADAFNELVDARLYGAGVRGCLTDLVCRPLRVENDRVVIDIDAATEGLVLEIEHDKEEVKSQ